MAEEVDIKGAGSKAKIRNPLGVIALTFVTLGIYGIFWYYFINRELADFGKAKKTDACGDSPGTSVVAITLGAFIIVPPFLSIYGTLKRADAAADLAKSPKKLDPGLGLLLWILISPIAMYILQDNLNDLWMKQSKTAAKKPATKKTA